VIIQNVGNHSPNDKVSYHIPEDWKKISVNAPAMTQNFCCYVFVGLTLPKSDYDPSKMFLGNITVPILLYKTTLLIINREEFVCMGNHAVCQIHKPAAGMILRMLHYYKCESNENLRSVNKLGLYCVQL